MPRSERVGFDGFHFSTGITAGQGRTARKPPAQMIDVAAKKSGRPGSNRRRPAWEADRGRPGRLRSVDVIAEAPESQDAFRVSTQFTEVRQFRCSTGTTTGTEERSPVVGMNTARLSGRRHDRRSRVELGRVRLGVLSERSKLIATTAFVARLPCSDVPRLARPCALGRPDVQCRCVSGSQRGQARGRRGACPMLPQLRGVRRFTLVHGTPLNCTTPPT